MLNPVQIRRLLARTLRVALDGGPAYTQLVQRWAQAQAAEASWIAALTWDGIGAATGWALQALDLRGVAPPEVDVAATEAYEEARQLSFLQAADLTRIGVEFASLEVPCIALKGSALLIGNLAPAPGIRWMEDLDVLVRERQVEEAAWVLESLGFARGVTRDLSVPEVARPYHDTFTSLDGRSIELHWRVGPARWGPTAAAERWFERATPSPAGGILLPAALDLFWHFLVHDARNHAWSSGSLRAALDLALVARAPGFALVDVIRRLDEDPRPGPLMEAIADAATLSPILAAEIEPSPEPRYLRLARWRDGIGRRNWQVQRRSEAIAWGATLDRARRFGGWDAVANHALRLVPESSQHHTLGALLRRWFLSLREAAFVGALTARHLISIPGAPHRVAPRGLSAGSQ